MIKANRPAIMSPSYSLEELLKKRNGGAINFRGINFQVLYSCLLSLEQLADPTAAATLRLEGIEDADLNRPSLTIGTHYIQLKSSENKINAGDFWSMNVLQNFIPVYLSDSSSTFRLVYNFRVTDGLLRELFEQKLSPKSAMHWHTKIQGCTGQEFDVSDFLKKITYEKQTVADLQLAITKSLYKKWQVNHGTELQYISALTYRVLQWSQNRESIGHHSMAELFSEIADGFSKAHTNEAIKNNWIAAVSYQANAGIDGNQYYEGKAAQPHHIALGLPARRKFWEKQIFDTLKASDVVIIRSSSGQGKSTLAWQMGYNLDGQHTIYRINMLRDFDQAYAVTEFLKTRVAIGQYPLIIIDGLSSQFESWATIIEETSQLPVKFIITTRHEDWIRYGSDISRIALRHIDISLSEQEAADIYRQFKGQGKIHSDIHEWQPVWEQVRERGLLIEYTYLLTRGQMIQERLETQIRTLNQRSGAAAKIEILRIVSLADTLNIKLLTSKLLKYIAASVGFDHDRGETLAELQDEYFLNFENTYIEGLHPVRSLHLRNLLHRTLPLSESLTNLYPILEEGDTEDFFKNAPILLNQHDRDLFYQEMAILMKEHPYTIIVKALNGISYAEPQKYWLENKAIYDQAFQRGGIMLFALHTVPGLNLTTFSDLINIVPVGMRAILEYYVEILKELPPYNPDTSDVRFFASMIRGSLTTRNGKYNSYRGLDDLSKWFGKLKIDIGFLYPLDVSALRLGLTEMPLDESMAIMQFHQIFHKDKFLSFVKKHKAEVIDYLRKTTSTLTIREKGKEIHLEYLIDGYEGVPSNTLSVNRIETIFTFLPFYDKYCTKALILPYPSPEIVAQSISDAHKSMSPQAITDQFEARFNRIWTNTIEKNYEVSSAYEWQKNMMYKRTVATEWCQYLLKWIDSIFEANVAKRNTALVTFRNLRLKLEEALSPDRPYPSYGKKMPNKGLRENAEKRINKWITSLSNSNNQVYNLISPTGNNDRNLASINLKAIFLGLADAQQAFHEMEELTIPYFNSIETDRKETVLYTRLYKSVLFIMSHLPIEEQQSVPVAKKAIEQWHDYYQSQRISTLSQLLKDATQLTGIKLTPPKQFIETETLITVPIAVEGANFRDSIALGKLLAVLSPLGSYPATFFTLLLVSDGTITNAVRVSKDFFSAVNDLLDSGDDSALKENNIYPITPTAELQPCFPDLKIIPLKADERTEKKARIVMELWKLNQARKVLVSGSPFNKKWLNELNNDYDKSISRLLTEIQDGRDNSFCSWATTIIQTQQILKENEFLYKLIDITSNSQSV